MKTILFTIPILIGNLSKAQDFPDLIITHTGDSVRCKITLVNDANIFYMYLQKKTEIKDHMALTDVKEYYQNDVRGSNAPQEVTVPPYQKATDKSAPAQPGSAKLAGTELITAQNHYYIGMGGIVLGGSLTIAGLSSDNPQPLSLLGGGVALVGAIFMIESWSHIGKAGKFLNDSHISLESNHRGLSLCYSF